MRYPVGLSRFAWRFRHVLGGFVTVAGLAALIYSILLTIRTYMPCPFWDEWVVIDAIADGKGPGSWSWLWSLSNEHRIVIPRLLIWIDLFWFGGKNLSLLVETFVLQALQWAAISYMIQRFTELPLFLKRTMQGLFAFCLFHPNQAENFTWAFQISFVIPFVLGTSALIAVAFFGRALRVGVSLTLASIAPLVASMSLIAGLLIGPVTILIALLKRLPSRAVTVLATALLLTGCAYLYGYRRQGSDLAPLSALADVKQLIVYVLTYFGASWTGLLPHKERLIASIFIAGFVIDSVRLLLKREQISDFEWLLLGECWLTLATALLTGLGRIQFGVGQAFASRYQTPAMLYWAALAALLLVRVWKRWPETIICAQVIVALLIIASMCTFPRIWRSNVSIADQRIAACQNIMGPQYSTAAAKRLYENTLMIEHARPFLSNLWDRH
jgi:hypothetical protein